MAPRTSGLIVGVGCAPNVDPELGAIVSECLLSEGFAVQDHGPLGAVVVVLGEPVDLAFVRRVARDRAVIALCVEDVPLVPLHEAGARDALSFWEDGRDLPAILRAIARAQPAKPSVAIGAVTIDRRQREVRQHGEPVELTPRQFDVLSYLVRHRGRWVDADELHREVCGRMHCHDSLARGYIKQLRNALGREADSLIETKKGQGWRIRPANQPE